MISNTEIDALICKFLSGEASAEEAIELENWKAGAAANKLYFDQSLYLFKVPALADQDGIKKSGWEKVEAGINCYNASGKGKLFRYSLGIAAAFVLTISIFIIYNFYNNASDAIMYNADTATTDIQLHDSSMISLAPGSTLILEKGFGKTNRFVTLTGAAKFSISHGNTNPFIVRVNKLYVKDIGTKFIITTSENSDTNFIAVQEGSIVAYDSLGFSINLLENEKARYIQSVNRLEKLKGLNEGNYDTLPRHTNHNNGLNSIRKNKSKEADTIRAVPAIDADTNIVAPIPPNVNRSVPIRPVLPRNK